MVPLLAALAEVSGEPERRARGRTAGPDPNPQVHGNEVESMRSRPLFSNAGPGLPACGRPAPRRLVPLIAPVILAAALGCREDAQSPTAPAREPALGTGAAVQALTFTQVSAGAHHTCALASDNRAFCWGANSSGQLGDGTSTQRLTPVPVGGGLRFLQVSAGFEHTCGITTNDLAYCWGAPGLLGDGQNSGQHSTPVAVAGGRRFRQIRAGYDHTCAVTLFDVGFCWGSSNRYGQLGTGGPYSTIPARVAGGLRFRRVVAGAHYTCGTTTDDRAYCWGYNSDGRLGDGTGTNRPKPVAVAGGLRFRAVVAGGGGFTDQQQEEPELGHTCGITTDDRAYCWGYGGDGQLGDTGTSSFQRTRSQSPAPVAGSR